MKRSFTHLPQRSQDLSGRTSAAGASPCLQGVFSTKNVCHIPQLPVIILPDIGKALGQNLGDVNGNNDVQI